MSTSTALSSTVPTSSPRRTSRSLLSLQRPRQDFEKHTAWSRQTRRTIMIQAEPPTDPPEDFEPIEEQHCRMGLSDRAVAQLLKAQEKASNPSLALRVMVESGGCHGYQYKMQVTADREPDDYVFQAPGSAARLFVDAASLTLLSGSTIDYATELIGSSFRVIDNPHADHGAGCGCGVKWCDHALHGKRGSSPVMTKQTKGIIKY
ncbi:[4Fe-4S] proteins maturation [Microbotryomycetes sp. JL221]|nr:[4Fe-4S] proteins maturation [Microbotryomycetes sp. JL221]